MTNHDASIESGAASGGIVGSVNAGLSATYRLIKTVLLIAIVATLAVFAVQNWHVLDVRFMQWSLQAPTAALIFGIFSMGAVFGFIARALGGRR